MTRPDLVSTSNAQSAALGQWAAGPNLSDQEFRWLATALTQSLGIQIPEDKKIMLETRLRPRLRELGLDSFTEYFNHCQSPSGRTTELPQLVDLVTTHHTFFFREAEHFSLVVEQLLPQLRDPQFGSGLRPILFWSAACSTGEEPYSLAMVLADYASNHPGFNFNIMATDISERVLAHARAGVFAEAVAPSIPGALRERYVEWSRNRHHPTLRIVKSLRESIQFRCINLINEYPTEQLFDLILLRNALIYFSRPMQHSLLQRVCARLRVHGWLVIGLAESLDERGLPLKRLGRGIYQKV